MGCARQFEELNKSKHDRLSFDCGEDALNVFIRQHAARHMKANVSRTMVLPNSDVTNEANGGKNSICAFYTITPSSIARKDLSDALAKKLPHYPIPVFLLAQLAVAKQHHGTGLGKITLVKALEHLYRVNIHMPAYAVIVDCLNKKAESFYNKFGFIPMGEQNGMVRMFLPMKQLEALFGSPD